MEASMISMFNMHVCVHACVCMCVCMGHPPHTHTHPHPHAPICHPPRGWTPRISKNSITLELIKIFQDLLNFAVLGSLRLWGGGRWVGGCQGHLGAWGGFPPHTHMHAHAHTRTYTHVYMYRNCKWPPTWRHP